MELRELPVGLRAVLLEYAAKVRAALGSRVEDIRLFGSRARGDARPDSDTDVWVLVDALDARTRTVPHEIAVEVLLDHGVDVSPTVMSRAEWDHLVSRERRIARDVQREGIAL